MATSIQKWPCDERTAHGPHRRKPIGELSGGDPVNGRWDPVYRTGYGVVTLNPFCPGVKAHPDTMIGRGSVPEVDVVVRLVAG